MKHIWDMEELAPPARFQLSGKGDYRSEVPRWNRDNRIKPGRRLIQVSEHQI